MHSRSFFQSTSPSPTKTLCSGPSRAPSFTPAAAGAVVAFEADAYEPSGRSGWSGWSGWSVLVQGVAEVVSGASDLARLSTLTVDPWAVDGSADRFVRIRPQRVTGRRFSR